MAIGQLEMKPRELPAVVREPGEKQQQMMMDRRMGRKPFTEGSQQGPRLGTYQGMPQENCCLFI
ncbi:uncharacterized protein BO88DRAFT_404129 [Aspergillus vadensis CBS 113365]|uniref:Uncharacterized protein n=1 Tax=Aspergillus vadensis (strain CBS 113365 / IMI 142717 / IBT 24658) TaxID=1448311 RepID=A0A319BAX6_ASPVC|nr:hypothetical protein BO88DRAFT_404129 [Aspergillus vadensis CBS 113365]PYH69755.1 hypothetical protein BO88DRAFT_404129 [Aspergillus vadensis CBS 113365]